MERGEYGRPMDSAEKDGGKRKAELREIEPRWISAVGRDLPPAGLLTGAALVSFFTLKLLGIVCWVLPIIGLLLPLLAAPVLWGAAAMQAVGSGVLCLMGLRCGERWRRWVFGGLLTVDVLLLAVILLVTAYFFGWIPRSWTWLWGLAGDIGGWFLHMPSAFALM